MTVNGESALIFRTVVSTTSQADDTPQMDISASSMPSSPNSSFTEWDEIQGYARIKEIPFFSKFTAIRLYFAQSGLDLQSIEFELLRTADSMDIAFVSEDDK